MMWWTEIKLSYHFVRKVKSVPGKLGRMNPVGKANCESRKRKGEEERKKEMRKKEREVGR
jgi:hypothetical protein